MRAQIFFQTYPGNAACVPIPTALSNFNGLDTCHGFLLYSGFAKSSCRLKISGDQGPAAVQGKTNATRTVRGSLRGPRMPHGLSERTLKGSLMP